MKIYLISDNQLDCNQPSQGKAKSSQVKAKAGCKSATALPIHLLSFFLILIILILLYIYNWTTSNAYISVNSKPILVKLWILNLMTNPSKVYDVDLNLNHSNSQHFKCFYLTQFSFDLYQTLDSTFKDQS